MRVMRVQEVESHDDREDKDAESENHSRHAPTLSLTRCLHSSIVVSLLVESVHLQGNRVAHGIAAQYSQSLDPGCHPPHHNLKQKAMGRHCVLHFGY